MIRYLDTSAAMKLLIDEPESDALGRDLRESQRRGDRLVASLLLHTELHCAARRRADFEPEVIRLILDSCVLVDVSRDDLLRAASSAWGLRSADAIHLATALRLDVDDFITYDRELFGVAQSAGLRAVAPR